MSWKFQVLVEHFFKWMIHSCWEVNYKRQELCEYLENQTEFQNLKGNEEEWNEGDEKKSENQSKQKAWV